MREFKAGALVFAKLRGYPAWPGRIVKLVDFKHYLISFYPREDKAVINENFVYPFFKTLKKFGTAKGKYFKSAMATTMDSLKKNEMEQVMALDNDGVFGEYYAKVKKFFIKKEIKREPKVKLEIVDTEKENSEQLYDLNQSLRTALPYNQMPDTQLCLEVLETLQGFNFNINDLDLCPALVMTIALVKNYYPAESLSSSNENLFKLAKQIREKAQNIFFKLHSLVPSLSETQFIKTYKEKFDMILKSLDNSF